MTQDKGKSGVDALAPTFMTDEPPDLAVKGTVCEPGKIYGGNLQVLGLLGQGGMGEIYLVRHTGDGGQYAMKVLRPLVAARADMVQRFREECRAMMTELVGHESFVRVFHVADDPQIGPFMLMEVLRGKTLAQLLGALGKLSLAHALPIGVEIAQAAQALHERGIIHRDLKPDNVFLTVSEDARRGHGLKLLDLGAAKFQKSSAPATAMHKAIGTGKYMSPEHIKTKPLGPTSDVYSLSHIVYEMIAGKHAFGAHHPNPSHFDYQMWHLNAQPDSLVARAPGTPPSLWAVLERGMRKAPEERWPSMRDFAAALRDVERQVAMTKEAATEEAQRISEVLSSRAPNVGSAVAQTGQLVGVLGPIAGAVVALSAKTHGIGSDPSNEVAVPDPSIAPRHGRIVVHPTGITEIYDDIGGLSINDKPTRFAVLRHGDRVRIGAGVFEYRSARGSVAVGAGGTVKMDHAAEGRAQSSPSLPAHPRPAAGVPASPAAPHETGPALPTRPVIPPGQLAAPAYPPPPFGPPASPSPRRSARVVAIIFVAVLLVGVAVAALLAARAGLLSHESSDLEGVSG